MKKQQGSALILAILLLAFFMALSLNMLTISRAKAQRAGDTVIGNKVLSDSDSASTLGYYELKLAYDYVKKGFVTTTGPSYYLTSGGLTVTTTIEGISLSSEKEYFGSYISQRGTNFNTSANAFLQSDSTTGSGSTLKLVSRNWNANAGGELRDLWYNVTGTSIGGYKIFSLQAKTNAITTTVISGGALIGSDLFNTDVHTIKGNVITVYSKNIIFKSLNPSINANTSYVVYVTRKSEFDGSLTESQRIVADVVESIVVELQK